MRAMGFAKETMFARRLGGGSAGDGSIQYDLIVTSTDGETYTISVGGFDAIKSKLEAMQPIVGALCALIDTSSPEDGITSEQGMFMYLAGAYYIYENDGSTEEEYIAIMFSNGEMKQGFQIKPDGTLTTS